MSVAFTREEDVEAAAAHLPDRPISPHPNFVTPEGLAALDRALADARAAFTTAQMAGSVQADRSAMARAARDLKYYAARRSTAQVIEAQRDSGVVRFGSAVTFDRADGRRQTFHIVGEDEADAARGTVSHVSPLARALLGKAIGDTATVAGGAVGIVEIA